MTKQKTLKQRVKEHLLANPELRDNDTMLVSEIWNEDILELGENFNDLTATQLLNLISNNQISKQQSILRCRREINNKLSETVGKSYQPENGVPKSIKKTPIKRKGGIKARPPLHMLHFVSGTGKTFKSKHSVLSLNNNPTGIIDINGRRSRFLHDHPHQNKKLN